MNSEATPQKGNDKAPRILLLDHFFREGDNINQRTDWFLIFHAILLEAFFAASDRLSFRLPVLLFGLIASALWLLIGMRQNWTMELLKHGIAMEPGGDKVLCNVIKGVDDTRKKFMPRWYRWVVATPVFAIVIPILTLITWAALLIITVIGPADQWVWLVAVIAVLLGGLLSWIFTMKAKPPQEAFNMLSEAIKGIESTPAQSDPSRH